MTQCPNAEAMQVEVRYLYQFSTQKKDITVQAAASYRCFNRPKASVLLKPMVALLEATKHRLPCRGLRSHLAAKRYLEY